MNTPRQPNVRTPIEQVPGRIQNSGDRTAVPTSFIAPFNPGSKPAAPVATTSVTAKDVIPGSLLTGRTTVTFETTAGCRQPPAPAEVAARTRVNEINETAGRRRQGRGRRLVDCGSWARQVLRNGNPVLRDQSSH